jgi:hypothetical protein
VAEIRQYDSDLHTGVNCRGDIQKVAAYDDKIDFPGHCRDPVELFQHIVQIGNEQKSHRLDLVCLTRFVATEAESSGFVNR